MKNKPKRVLRLAPCPAYDIEGTESWLGDMAAEGLLFRKDGFLGGFAVFEKTSAQTMRYRMDASPGSTSIFSDSGGEPSREEKEIGEAFGWEFCGKRGQFYIYRSPNVQGRELHTDPVVQAIAVAMVQKRERGNFFAMLWWLLLFPVLRTYGSLVRQAMHLGSWFVLGILLLVLWAFVRSSAQVLHLRKLRKKMQTGEGIDHKKDWKRKASWYRAGSALFLLLAALWIGLFFYRWNRSASGADKIPLSSYSEDLPFSTMKDFSANSFYEPTETILGNEIERKTDFLAPEIILYRESATIKLESGEVLNGVLLVDYYETKSRFWAELLEKEYLNEAKKQKHFRLLEQDAVGADSLTVYQEIFPTALIREGKILMRVSFFAGSNEHGLPVEQWVKIMLASIQKK